VATSDRLEQMVGDLVQIVETAKAVPMSASCVINRPEVLEILHELAAGVSEELAESRRLVAERDEVIAQARRDASEHIEAARRERGSMLSGTEMGREAERIRGAALEEARRIREDADNYVDDKLANFEVVLTKTLQAVGRGRAKMVGRDPMSELGEHMAEQDAVEAATRPEYDFNERDEVPTGGYQREAGSNTGEYPKYTDEGYEAYEAQPGGYQQEPSYQPQEPAYQEPVYQEAAYAEPAYQEPAYQEPAYAQQGAGYGQAEYGHSDYGLPEPELSHEFAAADMSGVFQRPDFSQDYPPQEYQQQPAQVAVGYGYDTENGYAANYSDPASVPYPVQPYGTQYEQQPEYHSGEYQAYPQHEQQQQYAQQPSHQQHPEASGFFDTGMIDVRQFRDDPYQQH
jgi:cell division septum initiation protein DivIVA